jgi:hypothetical protein
LNFAFPVLKYTFESNIKMKKIFTICILLIFLSSCSRTLFVSDIIKRNEISGNNEYKYDYSNGYYTLKTKSYSKNKRALIDSFKSDYKNLEQKNWNGTLNLDEKKRFNEAKINLEDSKFWNYDTTKNIIVSFDEQLPNINYKVIAFHYWDYSNARFLFPILILGNRKHLINKCVNKAIEEAQLNGADGVIINSNLHSSKLFVLIN